MTIYSSCYVALAVTGIPSTTAELQNRLHMTIRPGAFRYSVTTVLENNCDVVPAVLVLNE